MLTFLVVVLTIDFVFRAIKYGPKEYEDLKLWWLGRKQD